MNYSTEGTQKILDTKAFNTEVQALRLGDAVLVAIPGEPYSAVGTNIKQNVQGLLPHIVGCANDDIRYILTEDGYDPPKQPKARISTVSSTGGTPLAAGAAALVEEAGAGGGDGANRLSGWKMISGAADR